MPPSANSIDDLLRDATRRALALRRLPESTYRVQFHAGFTFNDATAIVPYLRGLGVTHLYASPYLKANKGSTHGYDVIDHCHLNPELGTEADHAALLAALRDAGMSHILDTVPNHVGVATNDNAWWNDVLANGRASKYADYFDIAWEGSPRPELKDRVLLPVLGDLYANVLERGELKLVTDGAPPTGVAVDYYGRRFPVSPADAKEALAQGVESYNGGPGGPRSFDRLDALLSRQHYRLAFWRVAPDEINYRRFFDINDLAALRQENLAVFVETHAKTMGWLADGSLTGLRVDHPDGLYDPKEYFERLQAEYVVACAGKAYAGSDWPAVETELRTRLAERGVDGKPLYVLGEKILAVGEPLPREWPIDGTSGYDFLNEVNGLFVDPAGEEAFTKLYEQWTGDHTRFEDLAYQKKVLILQTSLASELNMLAHQLDRIAQQDRHWRDFTLSGLRDALREVIACFPVYRSYITSADLRPDDAAYVERSVGEAKRRNPTMAPAAFDFIRDALRQRLPAGAPADLGRATLRFAGKFQQLTAPATAKGIEDTAFYIYNRFVSLNEVGGDPARFGVTPAALHRYFADRQKQWPHALSALSTHDTKRSEDVRARLNVLSTMPGVWRSHAERWREINARHKRAGAPDANDEYLLYQTLVGAWPPDPYAAEEFAAFGERIAAYMEKALREAKVHTSWTRPDEAYEAGVKQFAAAVLADDAFVADVQSLLTVVAPAGLINSLAQTVLRLTAPGVPDTYQGMEFWDFSLVDPDNRRPVDYATRREALGGLDNFDPAAAFRDGGTDRRLKMLVTRRVLAARAAHPGLFAKGAYEPIEVTGGDRVFAFARKLGDASAIVAVPRLANAADAMAFAGVTLKVPASVAGRACRNVLTDETVEVRDNIGASTLFAKLPVAVLVYQHGRT